MPCRIARRRATGLACGASRVPSTQKRPWPSRQLVVYTVHPTTRHDLTSPKTAQDAIPRPQAGHTQIHAKNISVINAFEFQKYRLPYRRRRAHNPQSREAAGQSQLPHRSRAVARASPRDRVYAGTRGRWRAPSSQFSVHASCTALTLTRTPKSPDNVCERTSRPAPSGTTQACGQGRTPPHNSSNMRKTHTQQVSVPPVHSTPTRPMSLILHESSSRGHGALSHEPAVGGSPGST